MTVTIAEEQARLEGERVARAERWVRGYWGARMATDAFPAGAPDWVRAEEWSGWRRQVAGGYVRVDAGDLMEYLGSSAGEVEEVRMQAPLGARVQWCVPAGASTVVVTGEGGAGGPGVRRDGRVSVRERVVVPIELGGDGLPVLEAAVVTSHWVWQALRELASRGKMEQPSVRLAVQGYVDGKPEVVVVQWGLAIEEDGR